MHSNFTVARSVEEPTDMFTRRRRKTGECARPSNLMARFILVHSSNDTRDYALKQIEGAGLSTSACREISVGAIRVALDDDVRASMIVASTRIEAYQCDHPAARVPFPCRSTCLSAVRFRRA